MRTSVSPETIERFERRIEEIEAEIRPQLLELRALKAGLDRLRDASEHVSYASRAGAAGVSQTAV